MHQNVVAFHATNGMLDKDAYLTYGFIHRLLFIAQLRVGVLLTLARLLRRDVDPIAMVVRLPAQIASISPHIALCKPIQIRGELLFEPDGVVMVTTQGTSKKDHKLVRQRHDRVLQRMLFFLPLECSRCFASSCERCYARSVASIRRRSPPCHTAFNSSGVDNSRYGISSRWTRVSYRIGAHLCRFSWAFDRTIAHGVPRTSQGGYVLESERTNGNFSASVGSFPLDPPPGVRLRVPDSTPSAYVFC